MCLAPAVSNPAGRLSFTVTDHKGRLAVADGFSHLSTPAVRHRGRAYSGLIGTAFAIVIDGHNGWVTVATPEGRPYGRITFRVVRVGRVSTVGRNRRAGQIRVRHLDNV